MKVYSQKAFQCHSGRLLNMGMLRLVFCAALLAFLTLFSLSACSLFQEEASDDSNAKASFAGVWGLSRIDDGETVRERDELNQLIQNGMLVYLWLDEDGSALLNLFNSSEPGMWEMVDEEHASISFATGETVDVELDGDLISFSQGEDTLEFTRDDGTLQAMIDEQEK